MGTFSQSGVVWDSITKNSKHEPFELQVGRGQITNHQINNLFGYSTNIGNVNQAIWEASATTGADYFWPTVSSQMTLVSTSASDGSSLSVQVDGLDSNFNAINEIIALNGTTPVPTVNSYYRINSLYVTNGINVGTINCGYSLATTGASGTGTTATLTYAGTYAFTVGQTIVVTGITPTGYNTTGAVVTASSAGSVSYANTTTGSQTIAGTVTALYARINPGIGQTQMAVYTVPAGYTFYKTATQVNNALSASNFMTFRQSAYYNLAAVRNIDGYSIAHQNNTIVNGQIAFNGSLEIVLPIPFPIPAGTDLKYQVVTSGGGVNGPASVNIYGLLIATPTNTNF